MGGDHEGGLATAIMLASLCMLLVPGAIGGTIGYAIFRKRPTARWVAGVGGFVVATALGVVGVFATFYESTFMPPTELTVDVPPGFHADGVYLVDDPSASVAAPSPLHVPFVTPRARVTAPASGVVRLRGLSSLFGDQVDVRLSDGRRPTAGGTRVLPGGRFLAYYEVGATDPLYMLEGAALEAKLRELETAGE